MTLVFLIAVVVTAVAGVVLLRTARRPASRPADRTPRFPWFWVSFPLTVLALVSAVGALLARFAGTEEVRTPPVPWALTYPDPPRSGLDFLSGEQLRQLQGPLPPEVYVWFWPVAALVGLGWSVWAWRTGRR
ncbi:amino acid permease [Corynebacterium nuruki]|uniref:amino acid permease n=1 Tax=Corynebacterium nuruki TaxID=1032851 RepID=UPI0039BEDBF1